MVRKSGKPPESATMSQQTQDTLVPQWTLGDRLGKALKVAGMRQQDMADELGIERQTVSNYINGVTRPKLMVLKVWAMRTGVPIGWLLTDETGRGQDISPLRCIATVPGQGIVFRVPPYMEDFPIDWAYEDLAEMATAS